MIMKNATESVYSLLKRADMKALPKEREQALFTALAAGDGAARETLIKANAKFAAGVARNYRNRGLPWDDLFSEAILGLTRAVDRFDYTKGFKFISYAVWWIRQGLLMALAEQSRTMKVPTALFGSVKKIDRARSRIEQKHGRPASAAEIARESGMKVSDVVDAQRISDGMMSLTRPTCGADESCTLQDILPGEELADDGIIVASRKSLVDSLLESLKPRDRIVMRLYFGLDSGGEYQATLDEVARQMDLTKERVRQIKEKSLELLKRRAKIRGIGVDE